MARSQGLAVRVPRDAAARKPPHGRPCNRCGVCCMATLCEVGRRVFGREMGPCPALTLQRGSNPPTYACGLTVDPAIPPVMKDAAALLIGSGQGCDARINGEPPDVAFYEELRRQDEKNAEEIACARQIWSLD